MIDLSKSKELINYKKSLKEISFDKTNKQYMTQSEFKAVDFDCVKDAYYSGLRSNDALIITDSLRGNFLFIEFKNGIIESKLEKEKIRSKIGESLLILNDIIQENLTFDKQNINFILVYNKNKNTSFEQQRNNSINKIATLIAEDAKMSYLINGFSHYKAYFHNVKTINEDEFKVIAGQLENSSYKF